jgi:hypothetical protein
LHLLHERLDLALGVADRSEPLERQRRAPRGLAGHSIERASRRTKQVSSSGTKIERR